MDSKNAQERTEKKCGYKVFGALALDLIRSANGSALTIRKRICENEDIVDQLPNAKTSKGEEH